MGLECFRRTQEQFCAAVAFYSRPMAALVAHIPNPKDRLDILHNLVEEHGEFQEAAFHATTFEQFLRSIGSRVQTLDDLFFWPEVRAFNSVLVTACIHDDVEVGLACMGIIEYAFAEISALIGNTVAQRGWVEREKLAHYSLHAELDKRHAEQFFAIVEHKWDDSKHRYYVQQGLELGAYVFDRLYRDLYASGIAGR